MIKENLNEVAPWEVKKSRADFTYDKPVKEIINAMCLPLNQEEFITFGSILDHYIEPKKFNEKKYKKN